MSARIAPEDAAALAALAGVEVPPEDLEPLAMALADHRAFVEPVLEADPGDSVSALTFDPRWRD